MYDVEIKQGQTILMFGLVHTLEELLDDIHHYISSRYADGPITIKVERIAQ